MRNPLSHLSERNQLLVLSVVVGIIVGFAAVILKTLISLIQHWLGDAFGGLWNGAIYLIILPGVGMLLAMLFCRYILKDNIGHGVTKALQAISRHESRIKPHNTWSSVVASSVTIGFGGSVGAEAPIVYTGAAIGSNFARKAGMSYRSMTILLGCGAAAAVAGIFNRGLVRSGDTTFQYLHELNDAVAFVDGVGHGHLIYIPWQKHAFRVFADSLQSG